MNSLRIVGLYLALFSFAARADAPDFSKMTEEQLVDSLQTIKEETVGIDSLAVADAFLAEDKPPKFVMGVMGTATPVSYPQMQILVQRGLKALPVLLRHVDDARPTQLSVPHSSIIMWSRMAEEYAPRVPDASATKLQSMNGPEAKLPYVVKVGDVCFALIGQIVGRPLMPVRYQPTGGMVINSPVESPKLAERVRGDWTGLTATDFFEQLIKDANSSNDPERQKPALQRLYYFFPHDYVREEDGKVRALTNHPGQGEK